MILTSGIALRKKLLMKKETVLRLLLVLPAFIMVALILIIPLIYTLYLSFFEQNLLVAGKKFVGLSNYVELFKKEIFQLSFWHSIVFTSGSVIGEYVIGLLSALLLYQKLKGKSIWRALSLLPWIVPIIVSTLTWKWMLTPRYGIIDSLATRMGWASFSRFWLGDPKVVMPSVIFINIWRSFPFYTIVILAALQAIPKDLYEAASIDGASGLQRFRSITLPHIKPISITVVILHIILTYDHFDTIWFLTRGGPANYTEILPTYLYKTSFQLYDVGYASSIAIFTVVSVLIIAGSVFFITREKA